MLVTSSDLSHVCDFRDQHGEITEKCHLLGEHLGVCAQCYRPAAQCVHTAYWELILMCTIHNCEVHK